jgi:O-antigen ligase
VALTDRRVATLVAVAISAAGSALAIAVIRARDVLVDGPFDGPAAAHQGRTAAVLVGLICLGTVAAYAPVALFAPVRTHVSSAVRVVVAALIAVAAIVAFVAADPGKRFDDFKVAPGQGGSYDSKDYVESHLLSGGGSGRWQFWSGANDEWAQNRVKGTGAGSFEAWWAANGSIQYFIRDAHSLWLETLGELGLVGLLLIAGFVLVVLARGALLSLRGPPDGRSVAAAATAVIAAWAVGAGIDWMWELTVVTLVAVACAALVTGPAVRRPDAADADPRRLGRGATIGLRVGLTALALAIVIGHTLPLLADRRLEASKAAARTGDTRKATEAARDARRLEPWASAPPAQLALLAEASGDLPSARRWIDEALTENGDDWRLWLIAARIETKAGDARQAQRSLRRARALNPRSPLFARGDG